MEYLKAMRKNIDMMKTFDGREKCCDNWYNSKTKLEWYLNHPENSNHKQVLLEGTRTTGAHWKIVCDKGIKDLMYTLNSLDYYTIYSCEGGKYGIAYVMIRRPRTKKRYFQFLEILKNYFNDGVLCIEDEEFTKRIVVYIWRKHQIENNPDFYKAELIKYGKNIEYGVNYEK